MNIWNTVVGHDSLFCEKDKANEYDANATAVVHNNLVEKRDIFQNCVAKLWLCCYHYAGSELLVR